jgi:galacturonosyltransferase
MEKILIFGNSDLGMYKFRKELINELCKHEKVTLIIPKGYYSNLFDNKNLNIIHVSFIGRNVNPFKELSLFLKYLFIILKEKPKKIISYTIKCNIYVGIISRFFSINFYANVTGLGKVFQVSNLFTSFIIFLYKTSLLKSKKVFFENYENLKVFLNNKIIKDKQGIVLNGAGVNIIEYPYLNYPPQNEIRILFAGRIIKEKGFIELLDSMPVLVSRFHNLFFDIVGTDDENLSKKIPLSFSDKILFYGFNKDIKPFILNSHAIILPSHHEGMANVLLEAGSSGRIILTSNIPGCKESVIDKKTGYLFHPKNSNDIISKVTLFMNLKVSNKVKMSKASSSYVQTKFNRNNVVERTINALYE